MSSPGSADRSQRVSDAGERALIERIRSRVPPADSTLIVVGIGDDAAVTAPERGALQVLTTDALVEGVHFDRRFSAPADIGHKALAVNVSDVASMGGASRFALLSLMLPARHHRSADVDGLLDGLIALATQLESRWRVATSPVRPVRSLSTSLSSGSVQAAKDTDPSGGRAG